MQLGSTGRFPNLLVFKLEYDIWSCERSGMLNRTRENVSSPIREKRISQPPVMFISGAESTPFAELPQ
jgi:hypothetical protein